MKKLLFGLAIFFIILLAGCPDPVGEPTPIPAMRSLYTTATGGNSHRGIMFDLTASADVIIYRFQTHAAAGTIPIEVYYRQGGFVTSSDGWQLAGSASVNFGGVGTMAEIPITLNLSINTGETYGFYITSTDTFLSITYSNSIGGTYSNADISIDADGYGLEYLFGTGYADRSFNGSVDYYLQ